MSDDLNAATPDSIDTPIPEGDEAALPEGDAEEAPPDPEAMAREAMLARLSDKMSRNADFPAVRESIRTIQSVARSDTAHLRVFTEQILQDVSVTNKLLRLINTAFYSTVGGGTITTVSRAIALMGFSPVAMLAGSVMLFDKLPKGPHAERMREEFAHSLMAAILAHEMCPMRQVEENAYISAMFQNLGRMLAQLHLQEEADQIDATIAAQGIASDDHEARNRVEKDVLGLHYNDLSAEIGKQWGWPEGLIQSLRPMIPEDPEKPAEQHEYLRMVVTGANLLGRELLSVAGAERLAAAERFHAKWGIPLGLKLEDMEGLVERATQKWYDVAKTLGLPRPGSKPTAKKAPEPAKPAAKGAATAPAKPPAASPKPAAPAPTPATKASPAVTDALSRGIEAISQAAMTDIPLIDVLKQVIQLMGDALKLQRVVVCLRDPSGGPLVGVLGHGADAMAIATKFRIPLEPPADLFGLLCAKNADTLISDAADPVIAQRLPAWFKQQVAAPTFLLLPLTVQGRCAGLIYGDRNKAGTLAVDEATFALLKTLRNQLVITMRLRSAG